MTRLAALAKAYALSYPPPVQATNMNGVAKLMVLVAEDVVRVNETGRTREMIVADAQVVLRAIFGGVEI